MADFAPNFTARFKLGYHGAGRNHSMTWRMTGDGAPASADALLVVLQAFLTAMAPDMYTDWTVNSAARCAIDSDVFLPYVTPTVAPTGTTFDGSVPRSATAGSLSFVGRTTGGLRAIFFFYGCDLVGPGTPSRDDLRIYASEEPTIADALAVLEGAGAVLRGNDGNPIVWYPYVNVKTNDYWGGRVRAGG